MNFKHLLEKCLIHFKENNNGFSGYTEGVDSYNNFLDTFTKNGYSFSTRSSRKWKHDEDPKFHFTVCGKVPHLDSPFLLQQNLWLQCIHGPKYYKRQKEVLDDHPTPIKRRKREDSKIKMNCPVELTVTEIKLFYTFKLTDRNKSQYHKYNLKEKLLSTWKEEPTITRFYFTISGGEHNHDVNKTFASQIIHESVKKEITKLYDEGTWSVSAIEKVLSNKCPSPRASAFKPNKRSIYNVVYKHIRRKNEARFEGETVTETLVEEEVEEGNDWEEYFVGGLSPVHVEEVVSSDPPPVVVAIPHSFDEKEVKANLRKFRQNLKDLMELTYVYDKNMDVNNALEDFIAQTEEMKVTLNDLVSKPDDLTSKKRVVQVQKRPNEDTSAEPVEVQPVYVNKDTVIYIYDGSA